MKRTPGELVRVVTEVILVIDEVAWVALGCGAA